MQFDKRPTGAPSTVQPAALVAVGRVEHSRMRPSSAVPLKHAGLLRRRSSTPNTTHDIIKLFEGQVHQRSEVTQHSTLLRGSGVPTTQPLDRPPVVRRPSTATVRTSSFCVPLDGQPQREFLQPQTVAFLDLLAAHRHKAAVDPKSRLGGQHAFLRPSSAPLATRATLDLPESPAVKSVDWEPLELTSQQQSHVVQRGRPLSAQARSKALQSVTGPSRPTSALRSTNAPSSSPQASPPLVELIAVCPPSMGHRHSGAQGNSTTRTVPVDFFAHISLRQCPFVDDMFDNPDVLHDVVTLIEYLCASCAHWDASLHANTQMYPLPWVSPWSQVVAKCRIAKEALALHIASPSSRLIGSRIFDRVVSSLNALSCGVLPYGFAGDPLLVNLAQCRVILEATVTMPNEVDFVMHEAPRRMDAQEDILISAPPPPLPPYTSTEGDPREASLLSMPQCGDGSRHSSPTPHSDRCQTATTTAVGSPSQSRDTSTAVSPSHRGQSMVTLEDMPSYADLPIAAAAKQHSMPLWNRRSFRSMRRQRGGQQTMSTEPNYGWCDAPFASMGNLNAQREVSHREVSEELSEDSRGSPAPRRSSSISMFKRGAELGEATAMLRRLSMSKGSTADDANEQRPTDRRSKSMIKFQPAASSQPQRIASTVQANSSRSVSPANSFASASRSGDDVGGRLRHRRPLVAMIVVASTFQDASIGTSRGAWEDAQQMAQLLKENCSFDYVSMLSSEGAATPEHAPTMAGVRREVQRVIQRYLVNDTNPVILIAVLGRGAVVPVGSIPGVGHTSISMIPYPSVVYAAAANAPRAKQPSPAIKIALLETAVVSEGLQSTDVITPEMFQDIFQWNGKVCKPAAIFFDVQETPGLGVRYSRDEESTTSTGFCSWTVPDNPAANFVSVYKSGTRCIGSYYFLKLLRGGILRTAAKEHGNTHYDDEGPPPSSGGRDVHAASSSSSSRASPMASILIPHYVARHILTSLAVLPSDVHYYLVKKLMRRNCNTHFAVDLHIMGLEDTGASNNARDGSGSPHSPLRSSKRSRGTMAVSIEQPLFQLTAMQSHLLIGTPLEVLKRVAAASPMWSSECSPICSGGVATRAQSGNDTTMKFVAPMSLWRLNNDIYRHGPESAVAAFDETFTSVFDRAQLRFRKVLHQAFLRVFKGKHSVLEELQRRPWVSEITRDGEGIVLTLALSDECHQPSSSRLIECASDVQKAFNASPPLSSLSFVEVETNASIPAVVVNASGGDVLGVDDDLMRCIMTAINANSLVKDITLSVVVELTLPSRRLHQKVDKVLRLGVLRHAVGCEAFVLSTTASPPQ